MGKNRIENDYCNKDEKNINEKLLRKKISVLKQKEK